MAGEFEPIVPGRSISVRIAEQILARIQAGEFSVGTKLPSEAELARQFGVSRPTVREALGALQFVGYIDSARGSGSRVASADPTLVQSAPTPVPVSPIDVLDLFEARLLVEPQVAALAAREHDPEKLDEAEALIAGMSLVVAEPALHAETDLRVHRALAHVCPNQFLKESALRLIDAAASPALEATRHEAWATGELPTLWEGQQHEVLAAIRSADVEAAADAAWLHLASAARHALAVLAADPRITRESVERLGALLDSRPVLLKNTGEVGPTKEQRPRATPNRSKPQVLRRRNPRA